MGESKLVTILVTLIITLVAFSFLEWFLHRYVMHRSYSNWILYKIYVNHALLHHRKYYKKFDYEPDEFGRHLNIKLDLWIGLLLGAFIYIPLWFIFPAGSIILLCVIIFHHLMWNTIHSEMHKPKPSWFRNTRGFKYLARYHYLHHVYPGKNFGIVFPFADFIMGTHIKPYPKDLVKMKELGIL